MDKLIKQSRRKCIRALKCTRNEYNMLTEQNYQDYIEFNNNLDWCIISDYIFEITYFPEDIYDEIILPRILNKIDDHTFKPHHVLIFDSKRQFNNLFNLKLYELDNYTNFVKCGYFNDDFDEIEYVFIGVD